jgi:hypothetical protein
VGSIRQAVFGLLALLLISACSLSERTPGYCATDLDCPAGKSCKLDSPDKHSCVPRPDGGADAMNTDGSSNDGDSGDTLPGDVATQCTISSCGAALPICDATSRMCRACADGTECLDLEAGTPVCATGRCVACGTSSDCIVAGQPVCDATTNKCRACGSGTECAAIGPSTAVCLSSGACAECSKASDCVSLTKPVCDMTSNTCRACGSGADCAAINTATPACHSSGKCVACVTNADCTVSTKPICDTTTNTCRACQADSECPLDPGICLLNIDGHCATPGETIYVQNSGSCSDAVVPSDPTAATSARPLCSMEPVSMFLSGTRDLVRIRGTVAGASSPFALGSMSTAILVGQQSGTIAASVNPAFSLQSGNVFIFDLEFSPSASTGITATGGTLHLNTVTVDSCKGGGILLDGAAFDIRNTTVTNNGQGQQGAITWGGILVNTLPATGAMQLDLVTIESNKQIGLTCVGPITGSGVLASLNAGGVDISPTCGVAACSPASPTCGAQP